MLAVCCLLLAVMRSFYATTPRYTSLALYTCTQTVLDIRWYRWCIDGYIQAAIMLTMVPESVDIVQQQPYESIAQLNLVIIR